MAQQQYKPLHKSGKIPENCPLCKGKTWLSYFRQKNLCVFVYCRNSQCRWSELFKVVD